ncbi:MAG: YdcF family protein [Candidatus Bipolaricaulota bacterium]|nr:YdcF family protein [Candidatus Bipolaricaulota bacterium]
MRLTVELLADPLPFLLALGLCLSVGALRRRWWLGGALLGLGLAALYFLATGWGANRLLRPLEDRYPALLVPPEVGAIVVLSGGEGFRDARPLLSGLSPSSLARLAEGVRLFWALGGRPTLWVVGGEGLVGGGVPLLAQAAWELGVPREKVRWLTASRNTWEDAVLVAQNLGQAPFLLVTSAFHMPRALRCFWAQGLTPLPAPCDPRAPPLRSPKAYLPSAQNLATSALALREHLASLWYRLRYFRG